MGDMDTGKLRLGDIVKYTTGVGSNKGTNVGVVATISPMGNRVAVDVTGRDYPLTFIRHSDGAYRMMHSTHYVRLHRATASELEAYNANAS